VIFAYRAYAKSKSQVAMPRQTPPGQVISGGQLVSPGGASDASQSSDR